MQTERSRPFERAHNDRKDLAASGCGFIGWNVRDSEAIPSQYVPQLRSLQNTKIVVYDFTDNLPAGPAIKRMGVSNSIDLSSRRAANVVAYFSSQGVNPNILSAKGFGETRLIASNDAPQSRAQHRR